MRISQAETQTHTLTLSIAPTTSIRAARCQLEVAASRALRAEGRDPSEYQFAEPDEFPLRNKPGFLGKFSACGIQRLFVFFKQTLRDGPGPRVFMLPIRSAGMHEHHLKPAGEVPE